MDGRKTFPATSIVFGIDKISGPSQYGASYEIGEKSYDKNDCGLLQTNYSFGQAYYTYYLFNPFGNILNREISHCIRVDQGDSANKMLTNLDTGMNIFFSLTTTGQSMQLLDRNQLKEDYYEPRTTGRFFITNPVNTSINFTTNYNKRLAFDFENGRTNHVSAYDIHSYGYYIVPIVRISDRWSFRFSYYWDVYKNDLGFANLKMQKDFILYLGTGIFIPLKILWLQGISLKWYVDFLHSPALLVRKEFILNSTLYGMMAELPLWPGTGMRTLIPITFNIDVVTIGSLLREVLFLITYKMLF